MLNTVETPAVLAARNMAVRSTFAGQKDTLNYLRACKHKNIEPYSDLPMSSTVFMVLGPEKDWWKGVAINPFPFLGGEHTPVAPTVAPTLHP